MTEPVITVRYLNTAVEQEAALNELMAAMGFRIEVVAGEELLVPLDPDHPEYAKLLRRVDRAKRKAGLA